MLVISLIYMDRCTAANPGLQISESNAHRLILCRFFIFSHFSWTDFSHSSILAVKFWCDVFYTNKYYAKVGGVPTEELNELEKAMLALLDFQLLVPPTLYAQYEATVKSPVERLTISVPTSFSDVIGSCKTFFLFFLTGFQLLNQLLFLHSTFTAVKTL